MRARSVCKKHHVFLSKSVYCMYLQYHVYTVIHLPTCNMSPSPSVLASLAAAKYKTISSFLHWSSMLPVIYKFTSHQFLLKLNSFIHFYPSRFIKNSQHILSSSLGRFIPASRFQFNKPLGYQGTPTASVRLPMWYKATPCLGVARKACERF